MAYYEVVLEGQVTNEPMMTVLHYDITGSEAFQQLSDAIALLMQGSLDVLLVAAAQYNGIRVRPDSPGQVGIFYPFTGGPIVGNYADSDVFGMIACNVRKLTTSGSRPSQGRIFQGGVPAVIASPIGNLDASWRASLNAFWESMIDIDFAGTGQAQMVIKASNPTAPNTVPYNPVTGTNAISRPAKQSRRNYVTP